VPRVLFIDDEPLYHGLVARALEPLQCEMHFSENGRDGLAKAHQLKPDIIITDVMMPDVNGYEVTRLLRREPQFSATPILVMTTQSGLQDKLKSFEAGADDHLTKPFEPAELAVRIGALLRRTESARTSAPSQGVQRGVRKKFEEIVGGQVAPQSSLLEQGCGARAGATLGAGGHGGSSVQFLSRFLRTEKGESFVSARWPQSFSFRFWPHSAHRPLQSGLQTGLMGTSVRA